MQQPSENLLHSYFNNQCTPDEAAMVLEWLGSEEGQAYYANYLDQKIKQNIFTPDTKTGSSDNAALLQKIYQKIGDEESGRRKRSFPTYRIAAAISLVLLSSLLIYMLQPRSMEVETAYGETREVKLGDGSTVFLNANSSLSYYPEKPREIWLQGEGFFEVQHTADDAPFQVHTDDLVVNVLGTEFNVSTRRKKTDVVLSNGKVRLDLPENVKERSMLMEPGEKVSYSKIEDKIEKKVVNPEVYSSWTKGTIVFDHTPLSEVFQLMEDTYGLRVDIQDEKLLKKEMNAQDVVRDLDVMMTLIEKTFNIKLIKKDNTIFLK